MEVSLARLPIIYALFGPKTRTQTYIDYFAHAHYKFLQNKLRSQRVASAMQEQTA